MNYLIFHCRSIEPFRPCFDGIFAAYIAELAFSPYVISEQGEKTTLVPRTYPNTPETAPDLDLKEGDRVFLLDFSYPAIVLEAWAAAGAEVVVLDHHETALADLKHLSQAVLERGGVKTKFDMRKSGAMIAWNYFFPDAPAPRLIQYVQDRDIWTKQLPGCDLVHLGLLELMGEKTLDQCLAEIDDLFMLDDPPEEGLGLPSPVEYLINIGRPIDYEIKRIKAYAVNHCSFKTVLGYTVPFWVCTTEKEYRCYSDIGNALAEAYTGCPFAVVQTSDGWALRSKKFNVSEIAKKLGGGGHRHASGCRAELPAWIAIWELRLSRWGRSVMRWRWRA